MPSLKSQYKRYTPPEEKSISSLENINIKDVSYTPPEGKSVSSLKNINIDVSYTPPEKKRTEEKEM